MNRIWLPIDRYRVQVIVMIVAVTPQLGGSLAPWGYAQSFKNENVSRFSGFESQKVLRMCNVGWGSEVERGERQNILNESTGPMCVCIVILEAGSISRESVVWTRFWESLKMYFPSPNKQRNQKKQIGGFFSRIFIDWLIDWPGGAKFTTCMREDDNVRELIDENLALERNFGSTPPKPF